MKKQISLLKVQATLDGVTFYQRKGKNLVRMANGPTKERILTDPSFEKVRRNLNEFGAGMRPVKAFYKGLKKNDASVLGEDLSVRLGSIFRGIVKRHPGERGKRPMEISKHRNMFRGLELKEIVPFDEVFTAPFSLSVNAERNEITLTVAPFLISDHVTKPQDATHFQLVNFALVLSDYVFSNEDKSYNPANVDLNGKFARATSDYIALADTSSPAITLVASLAEAGTLPENTSILGMVGIKFFEKREENYYAEPTGSAMVIEEVF